MKEGNAHYGEQEKRALKGQPYQIMITKAIPHRKVGAILPEVI